VLAQAPTPHDVGKLSTVPSQLLSTLSQTPDVGTPGAQLFTPRARPVREHAPTRSSSEGVGRAVAVVVHVVAHSTRPDGPRGFASLQSVAPPSGHVGLPGWP
jgi:hypothetical protein